MSDHEPDDSDTEFVEVDPSGRYGRASRLIGTGTFNVMVIFLDAEASMVEYNQVLQVEIEDYVTTPKPAWAVLSRKHVAKNCTSPQSTPVCIAIFGLMKRDKRIRYESTASDFQTPDPPVEKYEYQAEVSWLMDLIVNSLYSNKEVNASDALDNLRFLIVTDQQLLEGFPKRDESAYDAFGAGVQHIVLTTSLST
ncbi:hypothetical protein L2E82_28041 [Cichorium intybus]|uniref:Uncharacterized protein n=2 Tax=Cichorium intybus TaxID=13427 RepID=A0ACB9BRA1_CICIN|nr:hypothetical protein L2E82_36294 [Cichorium intybus]KAI3738023.1 hypothetical protein L2E82_28041 [Cichorium intybus]